MKIHITADNIELTEPFKQYIEDKLHSLDKLLTHFESDSVQINIITARTTNHHIHGEVYSAEINMFIPGDTLKAKATSSDARVAVDDAKDKLRRELIKLKDKRASH